MPNGRTHDIISLVLSPVVIGVTYLITKNIKTTAIIFGCYFFAAMMFNGDLDMNSKPYNRWYILKMIWIPYQLMFHHRSVFTHGLVIGTIIRILYIGIIPILLISFKSNIHITHYICTNIFLYICIGLELGAASHSIADKIF